MGKKKNEKSEIQIHFCGNSSIDVTGSMILIETSDKKILLECGMIQSVSNVVNDFKENSKPFPFKASKIDYVFLNHLHIDHTGRICKLVRDGFEGKVIATPITCKLLKPMMLDSIKIIERDAEYISRKQGRDVEPYCDKSDLDNLLDMLYEYDYDEIYTLDENISFRFLKNSHIIGAAQLELFIKKKSGHVEKILYTSDLGRINVKSHYVDELEKCTKANTIISECTYGSFTKTNDHSRDKDLERLATLINQVCVMDKGRMLIPVFSLSRSHQILTDLYLLYKDDENFKIPIICDSPLIWEITKKMLEVFEGENKKLLEEVVNWKQVKFIKDYNESKICIEDKSPKIVLSSSGFITKGRSSLYFSEYVGKSKDHIISVGYAPPNSILGKIKDGKKYITFEGKSHKVKCGVNSLYSYSSHISHNELINYLKSIKADKIYLQHGEMSGKIEFKTELDEELAKQCSSTRVIVTNKGTTCYI